MGRAFVLLAPLAVILATSRLADWSPPLPPLFIRGPADAETASILSGLTNSLLSVALALILGSVFLLREAPAASLYHRVLAILVLCAASSSIYAGYRMQIGLAEQLSVRAFDLARIKDRLDWQGGALFAAVTFLFAQCVERVFGSAPPAPAVTARPRPAGYRKHRPARTVP